MVVHSFARRFVCVFLAFALVLGGFSPLSAWRSETASAASGDILADTFDNGTLGTKPASWNIGAFPVGVQVAVDQLDGRAGKLMRFTQSTSPAASYQITRNISNATPKVLMTYQMRVEQTNAVVYLPTPRAGTAALAKFAIYNGKFAYMKKDASSWTELADVQAGTWYDIKLALDTEKGTYDFYVNNASLLSREPILAAGAFNSFYMGFYRLSAGVAFFDEFHVYAYKSAVSASFAEASYELAAGTSRNLTLIFNPPETTDQSAVWASSDPEVASVTDSGLVTARKPGTATITARPTENVPAASTTVNVYAVPVSKITVAPLEADVTVGSRVFLQAAVEPVLHTDGGILWGTDNPAIAAVDRYGELTGVGPGTVKVFAVSKDGSVRGEITVTVISRNVQHRLYVSPSGNDVNPGTEQAPFKTIGKAKETARTLSGGMTGDIEILLRDGTYSQLTPLEFTEADSGKNGYFVIYRSYPGESAMISGGRRITGWVEHDAVKGIYKSPVGTSLQTRQLFVNGVRAIRARSAGGLTNPQKTAEGYTSDDVAVASWNNPGDLELNFHDLWTHSRVPVQSVTVSGGKAQFLLEQPAWNAVSVRGLTSATLPVYYENAYELLDEAGEWYYDGTGGMLYYKPRAWEELSTAEVIAPVAEKLMSIKGASPDRPVRNLQFENLHFSYTTWMRPSSSLGHSDAQNNHLRYSGSPDELPDAAIMMEYANTVNFEGNDFSRLGITGIRMDLGVQNTMIRGNRFYDISGGAVNAGQPISSIRDIFNPEDHRKVVKNNDIVNNLFHDIGVDYKSAAAVSAGYPVDMDISHNEMYNLPYSGTHIGYGWDKLFDAVTKGVRIENNLIYDLMGMGIRDGGAIYSLGPTGGKPDDKNLVRGNYIRNQMDDSAVLYSDEGSTYWRFENNVIDLSESPPWHGSKRWYQAYKATIHDVDLVNNYVTDSKIVNNGVNVTEAGTTMIADGGNWPQAAHDIMAGAGIQPAYAGIAAADVRRWSSGYLDIPVGGTGRIELQARDGKDVPQSLSTSSIYYESLNPSVATVSGDGVVTGVSTGATKVLASIVNGTMLRKVEVEVLVGDTLSEIRLEGTAGNTVHYKEGSVQQLRAYGSTQFGNKVEVRQVQYSVTDPSVASVTPDGVLTAHKSGTAALILKGEKLGIRTESYYEIRVWKDGEQKAYPLRTEIADTDGWYVYPSPLTKQPGENSISISTPNSGHAVYQGRRFQNEMLEFDLTINGTTSWYALLFGKKSETAGYTNDDNYLAVVSSGAIELQRYNGSARTVIYGNIPGHTSVAGDAIPNSFLPFGQKKRVRLGTFEEAGGVRLIMTVDGREVFNYLDTADNAIRGSGYLGLISRNGSMVLGHDGGMALEAVGFDVQGPSGLKVGESQTLDVKAIYENGTPGPVPAGTLYTSSNPLVAAVDGQGAVTGLQEGTAVITAVYGNAKASFPLNVAGKVLKSGANLTGPAAVAAGQDLVLTYSLHNVTSSVYAQSAVVHYDPAHLQYVGAASILDRFAVTGATYGEGRVKLVGYGLGAAVTGAADVLKLQFRALPVRGTVTSSVYLSEVRIADGSGGIAPIGSGEPYSVAVFSLDLSALNGRIAEAQAALDEAVVSSTLWGHYPQSAVDALQAAVAAASAVAASAAGQGAVDQAAAALHTAITVFAGSVNRTRDIGDLAVMGRYYQASSTDSFWKNIRMYDLNQDGKLDIVDISSFAWDMLD